MFSEEFDQLNHMQKRDEDYETKFESLISKYEAVLTSHKRKPKHEVVYAHTRAVYNQLVRDFLASMPKICENCGAASPTIVRDGYVVFSPKSF